MAKIKAPSRARALAEKFRKASDLSWSRIWDEQANRMLDEAVARGREDSPIPNHSETITARHSGPQDAQ